jgi:sulfoxide reductase heme-binding subunit YedZ
MGIIRSSLNSRYFLWAVLAVPSLIMIRGYLTETIYYGELMHASGEVSARLLITTMAVTPLCLMLPNARWPTWLLRRRRYLGVAAFGYALLHTVFYLQKTAELSKILTESAAFEVWTGWLALLILVLLAATSNDRAVRMLRRAWIDLHRWVYAAAILTFLHWIFVAFSFLPGLIHALLLAALETIRIWKSRQSVPA